MGNRRRVRRRWRESSAIASWLPQKLLRNRGIRRDYRARAQARSKLSETALHELSCEVAGEVDEEADEPWLWQRMHAKLIDGFTFTMPDTPKNQAKYPQHKAQKPGNYLPIARAVAVVSLATACVLDAALGP